MTRLAWARSLLVLGIFSCSEGGPRTEAPCEAGAEMACECEDGAPGQATCNDAGVAGDCVCTAPLAEPKGRVFSADDSSPLEGVRVGGAGGRETQADAMGTFSLAAGDDLWSVELEGYAATRVTAPGPGGYREIFLKEIDQREPFEAEEGLRLRAPSGVAIDVQPSAVRRPGGDTVTGTIELELARVRIERPAEVAALPPLVADDGERLGRLLVETPVEVTLRDGRGELELRPDSEIRVQLPIDRASAPQEVGLWSFDVAEGVWRPEGRALRTVSDDGRDVYEAHLPHLSWWTTGELVTRLSCVRACAALADDSPAAGASVRVAGIDHTTVETTVTGSDGCFEAQARPQSQVLVEVTTDSGAYGVVVVETPAAGEACAETELPVLEATGEARCPGGHSDCGGRCAPILSDPEHCGACDNICGGSPGRTERCIEGRCRCAGGQLRCNGGCIDPRADRQNCGACSVRCADTEACVEGRCEEASCGPGFERCDGVCVDVTRHALHCGGCGQACAEGEACADSSCDGTGVVAPACEVGEAECSGTCTVLTNDPTNCGACGTACEPDALCVEGECVPPECAVDGDCDDGNPCTSNRCVGSLCVANPLAIACDDGIACTSDDSCVSGTCTGTPVDALCDDGNVCTDDVCLVVAGCSHNGNTAPCDDGLSCTDDVCAGGTCQGTDTCTGGESCDAVLDSCFICTTNPDCDDGNACTDDVCDTGTGVCSRTPVTDGTACDDGSVCSTVDQCVSGACVGSTFLACDDANECTDDSCDPVLGCQFTDSAFGTPCTDDGNLCTDNICDGTGSCFVGASVDCFPGPCMTTNGCNPATGQCEFSNEPNGTACDDGLACNTNDICTDGVCAGTPASCP